MKWGVERYSKDTVYNPLRLYALWTQEGTGQHPVFLARVHDSGALLLSVLLIYFFSANP